MSIDSQAANPSAGICPRIPIESRLELLWQMLTVAQSDFERSARLTAFLTWPRVGSRTGCVVGAAIEAAGSVSASTVVASASRTRLTISTL